MTPPPSLQDLIDTVRNDTPTADSLDQLVTAARTVGQLEDTSDALLGHFVDRCRRDGRSWSEISVALGVTKQAVHKRFAGAMADRIIESIPAPTLERFTIRARNVLTAAVGLAAGTPGPATSAHLLLGLYSEPDGLAAKALQAMNVSQDAVATAVSGLPGTQSDTAPAETTASNGPLSAGQRFAADGRAALRDALAAALELGHNYIGTEHLLLGLYRTPGSPAAVILADAGTTETQASALLMEMLRGFSR